MVLSDTPNPVAAEPAQVDAISQLIAKLQAKWDDETALDPTIPWWQFWKQHVVLHKVTLFLLTALDGFVLAIDKDLTINGAQKKATVLAAMTVLYDYILANAIPIWAKPFTGMIKDYVINVLISNEIDWMVSKYHNAVWPNAS